MSGSEGDGAGMVYVAHAWCADSGRDCTVGPWQWWGVYKTPEVADQRALAEARRWREHGEAEVIEVRSGPSQIVPQAARMVRRESPHG